MWRIWIKTLSLLIDVSFSRPEYIMDTVAVQKHILNRMWVKSGWSERSSKSELVMWSRRKGAYSVHKRKKWFEEVIYKNTYIAGIAYIYYIMYHLLMLGID